MEGEIERRDGGRERKGGRDRERRDGGRGTEKKFHIFLMTMN